MLTYTECMLKSVYRCRVESTDYLQDTVEVVQLLKYYHDLNTPAHNGNSFLQILRLYDTFLQPKCKLDKIHKMLLNIYF